MRVFRLLVLGAAWWVLAASGCAAQGPSGQEGAPRAAPRARSAAPPDERGGRELPAGPRTLEEDDLRGLAWRSAGPANMGGRIADIALAPGEAKTFYVAYGTGGLWKTTNNGTTFAPVMDKEATASMGSVVVADAPADWPGWKDEPAPDPNAPAAPGGEAKRGKAKIVWVGTGEGNGRNSSSWGHGVYRSTDGGATFANVGLINSHDIPALSVDPRNPDVCVVAALGHLWGPNKERGVYKTADGGKTWRATLQIDENTGACDVIRDPKSLDTLYAAMYMRRRTAWSMRSGGPEGGIYKSTDGGETWRKLAGGLPAQTGRIGLDIYAKNPSVVYAVVESNEGGWGVGWIDDRSKTGGVFRSDDGGETWKRLCDVTFRPFYFSKIRVDPGDDKRVYLLGWTLTVSDDGGRRFRAGGARKPHGDMHAMVIDPADTTHLIMGTDGGLYVSYDRAETWEFFNTMAVGEFYNIALDNDDPYHIGGGLQDNGTWIGPSGTIFEGESEEPGEDGGARPGITNADWRFVCGGDGFHVAFDPRDPRIVFAESQGGELVRINTADGKAKRLKPSAKEGEARIRFNWNAPFFISPHDPAVLYLGGNFVFRLTESGERWERISDDLSRRDVDRIMTEGSDAETHGTVVSLAESPLAAGLLWAGTDDGLIHVTADGGKAWANVTPREVGGLYVSRIEASHHARERAYASIDGHRNDDFAPRILATDDLGMSWRSVTGDLPKDQPVKVVREDLKNPDVLYCGTERAAYVSIDRGAHWVKLNGESLPVVAVHDLAIHPREGDLVAGTHGRSIYVLDDASPLSQLTPEVVASELRLFDMRPAKPRLFLPYGGLWDNRMFTAPNGPMGAVINYWVGDWRREPVKVSITDSEGLTVRSLTGPARPGINRVVWDLQPEPYDRLSNPDADVGQKPFVPAGEYTVTISCEKLKASKKVVVLPAPGATK